MEALRKIEEQLINLREPSETTDFWLNELKESLLLMVQEQRRTQKDLHEVKKALEDTRGDVRRLKSRS